MPTPHLFARRRATLLFAACLIPGGALAMWARMSDQELIERSDLIVVGRLADEKSIKLGDRSARVGVIAVSEVLKGSAPAELLLALPARDRPVSSTDLDFRVGQSGLWYLRKVASAGSAIYFADHPQRFVAADQARSQIEALRSARGR